MIAYLKSFSTSKINDTLILIPKMTGKTIKLINYNEETGITQTFTLPDKYTELFNNEEDYIKLALMINEIINKLKEESK